MILTKAREESSSQLDKAGKFVLLVLPCPCMSCVLETKLFICVVSVDLCRAGVIAPPCDPTESRRRSRIRRVTACNGVSPLAVELVSKEAKCLVDGHAEVLDVFLCHLAGAEIPKEAQV